MRTHVLSMCLHAHTHKFTHTHTHIPAANTTHPYLHVCLCGHAYHTCVCVHVHSTRNTPIKKKKWYGGAKNRDVIKWRWYDVLRLYKCHQMPFSRKGLASASSFLNIDYTKSGHQWWNIKQASAWLSSKSCVNKSEKNNASRFNWSFVGRLMLCIALLGSWAQNRVGTTRIFPLNWNKKGLIGSGPIDRLYLEEASLGGHEVLRPGSRIHFSSRMQHMVIDYHHSGGYPLLNQPHFA